MDKITITIDEDSNIEYGVPPFADFGAVKARALGQLAIAYLGLWENKSYKKITDQLEVLRVQATTKSLSEAFGTFSSKTKTPRQEAKEAEAAISEILQNFIDKTGLIPTDLTFEAIDTSSLGKPDLFKMGVVTLRAGI